jgi:hypothetical protein
MIILNRAQQRLPIGGHHFHEMGMIVRGETFDEVVEKVKDLRINNGSPIGDPEREVIRYYAERFPYMVKTGTGQEPPPPSGIYVRFRHWITTVWRNPPKRLVTKKEASLRWDVCKKCPKNIKKTWVKTEESEELERRAFMLRCGMEYPKELGFCACHRADLPVFVYIESPAGFTAKDKNETPPSECWVK